MMNEFSLWQEMERFTCPDSLPYNMEKEWERLSLFGNT